jgi:hypothetical protein
VHQTAWVPPKVWELQKVWKNHPQTWPPNNVQSLKKMGKDVLERQNPGLFIAGNIEIIRNEGVS